eukprot:gene29508-35616_t
MLSYCIVHGDYQSRGPLDAASFPVERGLSNLRHSIHTHSDGTLGVAERGGGRGPCIAAVAPAGLLS